jgi:hypothetical protein
MATAAARMRSRMTADATPPHAELEPCGAIGLRAGMVVTEGRWSSRSWLER